MVDVIVRKKLLKIQERLGMRIGVLYGTKDNPVVNTTKEAIEALKALYNIGLKAFVLPRELFYDITEAGDLYKERYSELLKIKEEASRYNIELSIRLEELSDQPDETLKIFSKIASIMDCRTLVIPPNFYSQMMPKDQALRLAVHKINEIVSSLGTKIDLGVETTGKLDDVGSLEDVIDIVKRTRYTEPVLNWAHIHARGSGALRERKDFGAVLQEVREELGAQPFKKAFFLFSGVSYGPSGEIKHIPYREADINLEHMIREAMSMRTSGTLIFEDPDKEKFILDLKDKMADMVR